MWGLVLKSEQVGTCLSTSTFFFSVRKNEKTNKMLTIKSYIVASLFNDVVILSFPFQLESSSKQKKIAFFGPNKGHITKRVQRI